MKCPICRSELLVTGKAYLQTLNEHVTGDGEQCSIKNKYQCCNNGCIAFRGPCWNEDGDFYSMTYEKIGKEVKKVREEISKDKFIDGLKSAIGSFARKMDIECYKHDEDIYIRLVPTKKYFTGIKIEWQYEANEDGEVLSRRWKIRIIIKNGHYISGIHMFLYMFRKFRDLKKQYEGGYKVGPALKKCFIPWESEKRWWVLLSAWILRKLYPKLVNIWRERNES
jgi:hypothetical protein